MSAMFQGNHVQVPWRHPSNFINISQLSAILSKWLAVVIWEGEACHDEATCVAFGEQSVKFSFAHSWSFHGVQFVEPSPISIIPQIHTPRFDCGIGFEDSRIVEIWNAIKNSCTGYVFTHLPEHMSFSGIQSSDESHCGGDTMQVQLLRLLVPFKNFDVWTQDNFATNLFWDISW